MIFTLAFVIAQSVLPAPTIADLEGEWSVALYYAAEQPPSTTTMVVQIDDDGRLGGLFYGSDFEAVQTTIRFDTPTIAAVTSDGSGVYFHSARLIDGRLEGQTFSVGRDVLMMWTAERTHDVMSVNGAP